MDNRFRQDRMGCFFQEDRRVKIQLHKIARCVNTNAENDNEWESYNTHPRRFGQGGSKALRAGVNDKRMRLD